LLLDNGAVNMEFAVTYRGQPWTSISVDVARAEAGESDIEWLKAIALTDAFGVTGPTQLPCLPLRFHVAQKLRRFAKRKSAFWTSSIFIVNHSLSSTSQIDRVGWRWLSRRCFVASQGQSWGQFHHATCPCPLRRGRPRSTIHLSRELSKLA